MKDRRLTDPERLVMGVFWDADRPLSASELIRLAVDATWSENHYFKILRSLEKDGFIQVRSLERKGTRYARQFAACISKEEYVARIMKMEELPRKTLAKIALSFVGEDVLRMSAGEREALISELQEMLERYKNEGDGE